MAKPKCSGTTRAGGPCTKPAGWGTDHPGVGTCKFHLGCTPTHQRAAQKEIATQAVRKFALAADEEIPNLDPRQVLAEEMFRSLKVVRGLDDRISELSEIHGPTFHVSGIATGERKPHVEWEMWQAARSHLKAVTFDAHRSGIDVFYAKLAQKEAELVYQIFEQVFGDREMELTPAQQQLGLRKAAGHLRLIEGGNG